MIDNYNICRQEEEKLNQKLMLEDQTISLIYSLKMKVRKVCYNNNKECRDYQNMNKRGIQRNYNNSIKPDKIKKSTMNI